MVDSTLATDLLARETVDKPNNGVCLTQAVTKAEARERFPDVPRQDFQVNLQETFLC